MRLVLVPLILAALLAVGPTAVRANTNQAAAEKIAAGLGEKFPGYDIAVSYQNGKVRLAGQVNSPQVAQQAAEFVRQIPGVKVTDVESGLHVAGGAQPAKPAPQVAQQTPTVPPTQAKVPPKRSILTPPQQPQVAVAPIPIPQQEQKRVNVQQVAVAARANAAPPIAQHAPVPMPPQQVAGPPQGAAYAPEAYGPQGPLPGQYNQPYLPEYAWPSYAAYPNYAEVCYPKQYSPKAWPYIGPFYPYPQAPLGWRKVTMEHHDGWWWLDFDDGAPSGPFSPLFRQPTRYTY